MYPLPDANRGGGTVQVGVPDSRNRRIPKDAPHSPPKLGLPCWRTRPYNGRKKTAWGAVYPLEFRDANPAPLF